MSIPAPSGVFANRENELAALADVIAGSPSPQLLRVWSARPAAGMTALLRYFQKLRGSEAVVLYMDAADGVANTLFGAIYTALHQDYRDHWIALERDLRHAGGASKRRQLAAAFMSSVPYIGSAAEKAVELSALEVNPTYYPSLPAEVFSRALRRIAQRSPVVLLIDNAQALDDGSLDLLASTAGGVDRIHYELAYIHRDHAATATFAARVRRLEQLGYVVRVETLPPLSTRAVERWASLVEGSAPVANVERLVAESDGDVYEIARRLRTAPVAGAPFASSPLATAIINFLAVARQALRVSDLSVLLTQPNATVLAAPTAVDAEVQRLVNIGALQESELPDGDTLVRSLHTSPAVVTDELTRTRCATALYDYFVAAEQTSFRHAAAEVLPLLYRLSKLVAPDDAALHAQRLLRLSLAMGSARAAEGLIRNATLPPIDETASFVDYVVRVCALLATRRYADAAALLQVPARPEWASERLVRVLLAISLNRCRAHAASDELIRELIGTSTSLEEQVLLLSYSIAGMLHDGDVSGARTTFETHETAVEAAANFGYLLRNAASAMAPEDAVRLLGRAVERFAETGDTFGWASSRSNRGNNLALLGRIAEAREEFEAARDVLQTYGAIHLHIVLNNLGIMRLFGGDAVGACELFRRARTNAENAMPRTLAGINLCVAQAASGATSDAAALLVVLGDEAATASVDRVRQQFFSNAYILSVLLGFSESQQKAYYDGAIAFPDRWRPTMVLERLNRARRVGVTAETLLALYVPAYLAYWYQNPLEMLPLHLLAEKARVENEAN